MNVIAAYLQRLIFRIVAATILLAFLSIDSAWVNGTHVFAHPQNSTLSPKITVQSPLMQNGFRDAPSHDRVKSGSGEDDKIKKMKDERDNLIKRLMTTLEKKETSWANMKEFGEGTRSFNMRVNCRGGEQVIFDEVSLKEDDSKLDKGALVDLCRYEPEEFVSVMESGKGKVAVIEVGSDPIKAIEFILGLNYLSPWSKKKFEHKLAELKHERLICELLDRQSTAWPKDQFLTDAIAWLTSIHDEYFVKISITDKIEQGRVDVNFFQPDPNYILVTGEIPLNETDIDLLKRVMGQLDIHKHSIRNPSLKGITKELRTRISELEKQYNILKRIMELNDTIAARESKSKNPVVEETVEQIWDLVKIFRRSGENYRSKDAIRKALSDWLAKGGKFKGEKSNVYTIEKGQPTVVGILDRNVALHFGFRIGSATALIVFEDGISLQRRAAHKVEGLALNLDGGYIQAGRTPEETIREELMQERGLTELRGKLVRVGVQQGFPVSNKVFRIESKRNKHVRWVYLYFPTLDEEKLMRGGEYYAKIKTEKELRTRPQFNAWLKQKDKEQPGYWEVDGQAILSFEQFFDLRGKDSIPMTEEFSDGRVQGKVPLSKDILLHLVNDSALRQEMRGTIEKNLKKSTYPVEPGKGAIHSASPDELRGLFKKGYQSGAIKYKSWFSEWQAQSITGPKILGAGIFLLRKVGGEWCLILGQRAQIADDKIGVFSAPVGKVDKPVNKEQEKSPAMQQLQGLGIVSPEDFDAQEKRESIISAAVREASEETGVLYDLSMIVARINDFTGNHPGILLNFMVVVDKREGLNDITSNTSLELGKWTPIPVDIIINAPDSDAAGRAVEQFIRDYNSDQSLQLMPGLKKRGMGNLRELLVTVLQESNLHPLESSLEPKSFLPGDVVVERSI